MSKKWIVELPGGWKQSRKTYKEFDIKLQTVSDEKYLKSYNLKSPIIGSQSSLNSTFNFSGYNNDLEFSISSEVYEDLTKVNESDRYEYIYPSYNLLKEFDKNPKNGKTIWKQKRPSVAQKESLESFGTIIPHNNQLLIAGGDVLTGHDPKSGKEIWRWGTWNPNHKEQWWRLVPSPVVGKGVILVCAPKKAPIFAIKTGLKGIHEGSDGLSWETKAEPTLTSDVPTPLFYDGKFYILSDLKKVLSRVNPQNGKIEWSKELPGKYKWRSSPTAGDGKVYIMNHNGEVVVISSQSGEILHLAKMGGTYDDNTRSSVSIGSKELFIRTNEILYCIQ